MDIKLALKDAKSHIDSSRWGDVLTLTAQMLGLPESGSHELDVDAVLSSGLTATKSIPKDLLAPWYQTLVFRGMACSNEAKTIEKSVVQENPQDKTKKDRTRDASTLNCCAL